MSFSLVYLINRFFFLIKEFILHWYKGGFLTVIHQTLNILEKLDRGFALKITLLNFFRPLYQDYTLVGYILGFFFRLGRIISALLIYLIVVLIALGVYIIWAAVPLYSIYRGLGFLGFSN